MTVPAAYTARLRRAEARRGDRCVVCGHRKTIATEAGPMCEAHARFDVAFELEVDQDQETDDQ